MKKVGFDKIEKIINGFANSNKDLLRGVDLVIGMSRGGLIPAALLATAIDKPLLAAYINKKDEIFFDRSDWIDGKNVLVVDDVVRSGRTMWLLKDCLLADCRPKNISFFALYRVRSLGNNNYKILSFAREIDDDIIFPWDYDRH